MRQETRDKKACFAIHLFVLGLWDGLIVQRPRLRGDAAFKDGRYGRGRALTRQMQDFAGQGLTRHVQERQTRHRAGHERGRGVAVIHIPAVLDIPTGCVFVCVSCIMA